MKTQPTLPSLMLQASTLLKATANGFPRLSFAAHSGHPSQQGRDPRSEPSTLERAYRALHPWPAVALPPSCRLFPGRCPSQSAGTWKQDPLGSSFDVSRFRDQVTPSPAGQAWRRTLISRNSVSIDRAPWGDLGASFDQIFGSVG